MTTRITVTTGDGGLLERNAQQQAAARQAALVKAQAEQAAATGAEQQRQRRIASGLDPATGRPLPSAGSTSRLTRIDQEPAAFRADKGETFLAYCPIAPTITLPRSGFFTSLFARTAKDKDFVFENTLNTDFIINDYYPSGGPFGLPYIQSNTAFGESIFVNLPVTPKASAPNGAPTYDQDSTLITKRGNAFTLEISHAAFSTTGTGTAGAALTLDLLSSDGTVRYEVFGSVGSSTSPGGPGIDTYTMRVIKYNLLSQQSITLVFQNQELAYQSIAAQSGTWTQTTLALEADRFSLYSQGNLVETAILSEPVQAKSYLAYVSTRCGSRNAGGTPGLIGWSATRLSSRARYSGSYTMAPISGL